MSTALSPSGPSADAPIDSLATASNPHRTISSRAVLTSVMHTTWRQSMSLFMSRVPEPNTAFPGSRQDRTRKSPRSWLKSTAVFQGVPTGGIQSTPRTSDPSGVTSRTSSRCTATFGTSGTSRKYPRRKGRDEPSSESSKVLSGTRSKAPVLASEGQLPGRLVNSTVTSTGTPSRTSVTVTLSPASLSRIAAITPAEPSVAAPSTATMRSPVSTPAPAAGVPSSTPVTNTPWPPSRRSSSPTPK